MEYIKKLWRCSHCNQEMVGSILDQVRHRQECELAAKEAELSTEQEKEGDADGEENANAKAATSYDPLRRLYSCPECEAQMLLTTTEILKHRRSHASASSVNVKEEEKE